MSPRWIASREMPSPAMFTAHRWPARPSAAARFWAWTPRTRPDRPAGLIVTVSPGATRPDRTVPVTTVPAPVRVKLRSTVMRNRPSAARVCVSASARMSAWRNSSIPLPVRADTARICAPASPLGASRAVISARRAASSGSSARSHLLIATMPRRMPSRSRIARCSRVCGMIPSSAAMTSRAMSMPPAPATIV
ncbi:hypothetical protein CG51_16545 [Haematobacter missouriensis]|nr:hypothetical protein CG51_16545 [Haematobacter missouriensis]